MLSQDFLAVCSEVQNGARTVLDELVDCISPVSTESQLDERVFIEERNHARLGDVSLFKFEPHVRVVGGRWGFKHENIYYFNQQAFLAEM